MKQITKGSRIEIASALASKFMKIGRYVIKTYCPFLLFGPMEYLHCGMWHVLDPSAFFTQVEELHGSTKWHALHTGTSFGCIQIFLLWGTRSIVGSLFLWLKRIRISCWKRDQKILSCENQWLLSQHLWLTTFSRMSSENAKDIKLSKKAGIAQ